jgi:hypothetical protein
MPFSRFYQFKPRLVHWHRIRVCDVWSVDFLPLRHRGTAA